MVNYSFQSYDSKTMARVAGRNLAISRKAVREIGVFMKNRQVDNAINYLEKVAEGTAPVPYGKFNKKTAHHAPFGPSGYPRRASRAVINMLQSLKSNAQAKGINTSKLFVIHCAAHKGSRLFHPGGMERKNTHFEIVAQEKEVKTEQLRAKGEQRVAK